MVRRIGSKPILRTGMDPLMHSQCLTYHVARPGLPPQRHWVDVRVHFPRGMGRAAHLV